VRLLHVIAVIHRRREALLYLQVLLVAACRHALDAV
jgi:hypothetical protein